MSIRCGVPLNPNTKSGLDFCDVQLLAPNASFEGSEVTYKSAAVNEQAVSELMATYIVGEYLIASSVSAF